MINVRTIKEKSQFLFYRRDAERVAIAFTDLDHTWKIHGDDTFSVYTDPRNERSLKTYFEELSLDEHITYICY